MTAILRALLSGVMSVSILFGAASVTASARVQAEIPALRLLHEGHPVTVLAPGASFTAQVRGVAQQPAGLCLGLASLLDPYAVPVTLGIFQQASTGALTVQATVPTRLFPAEPVGPFLLYAGRCSSVAPDGDYADIVIPIVQAAG